MPFERASEMFIRKADKWNNGIQTTSLEGWNLSELPRGLCIIINVKDFKHDPFPKKSSKSWYRHGSQKDVENLVATFHELYFKVQVHANPTKKAGTIMADMIDILEYPELQIAGPFEEFYFNPHLAVDSVSNDTVKDDRDNDDDVKNGIINGGRVEDGPMKNDTVKDYHVKDDRVKDDSVKDDSVKDDSVKDDSVKDDPVTDHPVKVDAVKDNPI
ncbi:unnamed protein product [Cyprideis torosa]|uniref:Uncharacterized protein n=1 Tax=Cyprideis torosa TaxID=163714 RepID=A0A7R8WNK7_9CRUS|nr:unnamed protein product [Cyprideis torosa]CAG0904154.1 unnamed protein product [Cyprideis torosa]